MPGVKLNLEQSKRLSRDKFAAHFVSRKFPAFEQQDALPVAARNDRRRGTTRTTTDDNQVVLACR